MVLLHRYTLHVILVDIIQMLIFLDDWISVSGRQELTRYRTRIVMTNPIQVPRNTSEQSTASISLLVERTSLSTRQPSTAAVL
jgi:hypothetical protein